MERYHATSVQSSRFKDGRMLAIAAVYRRATLMRAAVLSAASGRASRGRSRRQQNAPF
jgi:hypothetical protein